MDSDLIIEENTSQVKEVIVDTYVCEKFASEPTISTKTKSESTVQMKEQINEQKSDHCNEEHELPEHPACTSNFSIMRKNLTETDLAVSAAVVVGFVSCAVILVCGFKKLYSRF